MFRWLIAFLLLSSCAPYVPVQEPAYSSNKLVEAESHDVIIRLQHLSNQFNYFVFDLEVINHAQHPILLSPHQNVCYFAAPTRFSELDGQVDIRLESAKHSRLLNKLLRAEQPYNILDKVNQKLKSRQTTQVFFMLVGAGLAVYDVVKDVEESKKEEWIFKDASRAAGRNALIQTAFVSSDFGGSFSNSRC